MSKSFVLARNKPLPGWKHPGIFIFAISVKTIYTLHGKTIVHLTHGSSDWMHFFYDASGKVASVNYNGQRYAYLYNMQGDVMGLVDSTGAEVVKYTYDAWGRLLSKTGTLANTLGTLNPFRYRGYVYDDETGLYYLRSRYYNPTWGRFLNADNMIPVHGKVQEGNLFTYCKNNGISYRDDCGKEPENDLEQLEEAESHAVSILLGVKVTGLPPNSVFYYINAQGKKLFYWTDGRGKVTHSRHYTNHGNPEKHPLVPHDHDWFDKDDGSGNVEESKEYMDVDENFSENGAENIKDYLFCLTEPTELEKKIRLIFMLFFIPQSIPVLAW